MAGGVAGSGRSKPSAVVLVLVTCPRRAARRLSEAVVRQRLAACANIVPDVGSVFWWEGKVEHAREALVLLKTTGARFERLRKAVLARHPYGVPEVIAIPVTKGHLPYVAWLRKCVAKS